VGKGTLIEKLKAEFPQAFGFSVSHTTRAPRPGEEDGVHYNFVDHEQMNKNIEQGLMLEHANVHGNVYGTSCAAVEKVSSAGKVCILDIDVQGCRLCRKANLDGVYVFISPPSMEDLEKRLRGRGTETEDKVLKRLANAKGEIEARDEAGLFDHKVVNDDLEKTYQQLRTIIKGDVDAALKASGASTTDAAVKDITDSTAQCSIKSKPKALVIAGPSGVGKGTLIEKLKAEFPQAFGFSVSHTTRAPRPGEEDGVHYNFVDHEQMNKNIEQGLMLEHANVHGNVYGTSCAAVEKVSSAGKVCILDIDVQGCRLCRKANLDGVYVFISPPSMEDLEKRLRGRGTETEDKVLKRLANAKGEIEARDEAGLFDFKITNDNLEKAYEDLKAIIKDDIDAALSG